MTVHQLNGDIPTEADSWEPIDLTQLPEKPPIQPELGATRLVYPGKRHVFSGPPESAKTLAAYCVLIQVTRTDGYGILIDFEMGPHDARQRLRELGATDDELRRIAYLEPDERATPQRIGQLVQLEPDLVVVDASAGIYTLEGLDDNKRGDVEKISNLYIRSFWRHGIATILIDHVVKDSESRGRFVIGSERKLGGADVHLGFDTLTPISRGTAGHYKITNHKDRGGYLKRGHLADVHLNSDPDTHQISWEFTEPTPETAKRPTRLMQRVSEYLERQTEPVSRNTVAGPAGIKGNREFIFHAIDALVREGFAGESTGPRGAKHVQHLTAYREDDPALNPEPDRGKIIFSSLVPTGSSPVPRTSQEAADKELVPTGSDWFHGTGAVTGSTGSPPLRGEPQDTSPPSTPEPPVPQGWLGTSGELIDSEVAAYLTEMDRIAPDADDELPF